MQIKHIRILSLFILTFIFFSINIDAQEVRTNDRGERIVIFPDGSWRYYVLGDSIYVKNSPAIRTIQEEPKEEKPIETFGNDDEIAEAILIAERATAAEKSAKFVLQNAVRRKEAIDESIAYAKTNNANFSSTRVKELDNQLKQVKEEIRVAKKELKISTIKRRLADKLLTVRSQTERDRLIGEIDNNTNVPVNSKTPNPKTPRTKETKVAKTKVPKEPKVRSTKVKEPKVAKAKVPKEPQVRNTKVKEPKVAKTKTPKEPRVAKTKVPKEPKVRNTKVKEPEVAETKVSKETKVQEPNVIKTKVPKEPNVRTTKVKEPKVAKTKVPEEPKVAKTKVPKEPRVRTTKVKEPRIAKTKTPKAPNSKSTRVKKPKTPKGTVNSKTAGERIKKPKTKLPKGKAVATYASSMKWDGRDVMNDPPSEDCNIQSTIIDEFSQKKTVVMTPALLFSHTPEEIKNYLQDRDFITCHANLATKPGLSFLSLKFTIASDNARKNFGVLEQGTLLKIMFLDGSTVNLYNGRFDGGKLDPYTGNTIYETSYIIDKEKQRELSRNEIDKIRVVWSTGFEDYTIYNVDFFINQYNCLSKNSL